MEESKYIKSINDEKEADSFLQENYGLTTCDFGRFRGISIYSDCVKV